MNVDEAIEIATSTAITLTKLEMAEVAEVLAREVERLRAEVESVIRLGPHPVEQVQMPLATFIKTRFVPVWEYNELASKLETAQAELAASKAASVCPVRVLNIFEGTYESDRYIELRTDAEADTFTDWLRERMKDTTPPTT